MINFLNKQIVEDAIRQGKTLRIISVVPSLTEYLYTLGFTTEVVGITKFCVHPTEWFTNKTRIGGTKNIQIEKTIALQPNVIIVSKEENVQEQIEALAKHCTIIITNITTVENSLEQLLQLATALQKPVEGKIINKLLQQKINQLSSFEKGSALYCIWKNPYLFAGVDTYINSMLQVCGYKNIIAANRYPELSIEQMQELAPQHLLLSSEPYPFKQKHIDELQQLLPNTTIELVDGEFYSWYGSRLIGG